jgi:hypothetical protein
MSATTSPAPTTTEHPAPPEQHRGAPGVAHTPTPAAAAPAQQQPWEGHPGGPFAGLKAWAEAEFAKLEAMIKAGQSGSSAAAPPPPPPPASTMGTSITQPSMTHTDTHTDSTTSIGSKE